MEKSFLLSVRRASLALFLVLTVPVLSGCLGIPFLPEPDDPESAPEKDGVWVTVDPLRGNRAADAFAFWIPEETQGVRLVSPAAPTEDDDGRTAWSPSGDRHLRMYEDRLRVYGPDGARVSLERARETPATDNETPVDRMAHERSMDDPAAPHILFQTTDPEPGRYVVVVHGDPALPLVSLRLPRSMLPDPDAAADSLAPVPFVTLPRAAVRHHLATLDNTPVIGRAETATADGTLPLGPQTLLAWGGLLGAAADVRLRLETDSGTVQDVREPVLVRPAGGMDGSYGGFASGVRFDAPPDPVPLRADTLRWSLDATGEASGFATLLTAGDAPRPVARPVDLDALDGERVALEGRIRSGEAGVVDLPEGTYLGVRLEDPDGRYGSAFRLYDLDGDRLGWGAVHGDRMLGHALPAGPVIVVNDGPRSLMLTTQGPPPADITIHPADTDTTQVDVPLTTGGAPKQAVRAWSLPGPALQWHSQQDSTGSLTDPVVYVARGETVVAQTPRLGETGPDRSSCCRYPGMSVFAGDPDWLDAGDHRVRVAATSGDGTMTLHATVVDLEAVQASFTAPTDTETDPDGDADPHGDSDSDDVR